MQRGRRRVDPLATATSSSTANEPKQARARRRSIEECVGRSLSRNSAFWIAWMTLRLTLQNNWSCESLRTRRQSPCAPGWYRAAGSFCIPPRPSLPAATLDWQRSRLISHTALTHGRTHGIRLAHQASVPVGPRLTVRAGGSITWITTKTSRRDFERSRAGSISGRAVAYIAPVLVAGAMLGGYAFHEHRVAQNLRPKISRPEQTLAATRSQVDDLTAKVNALAAQACAGATAGAGTGGSRAASRGATFGDFPSSSRSPHV